MRCISNYTEYTNTCAGRAHVDLDKTILCAYALVDVTITETGGDGPNTGTVEVEADEDICVFVYDEDVEVEWSGSIDVASAWLGVNLAELATDPKTYDRIEDETLFV
jgi:hypothetical protein